MYRLYDYLPSGNCWKVRFLLHQLGLPWERVDIDLLQGPSVRAEVQKRNAVGKVPVLELPDGRCLSESNNIALWLAEDSDWGPTDPWDRQEILRWMFFEQNNHEPNIAAARFWVSVYQKPEHPLACLEMRRHHGDAALKAMEQHLAGRTWFVGDRPSVADVVLYAYTHTAEDGGFSLEPFPEVRAWLQRFAALPGYIGLLQIPEAVATVD